MIPSRFREAFMTLGCIFAAALAGVGIARGQMGQIPQYLPVKGSAPACTIGIQCVYAFGPWYSAARSYSAAYAAPGTNPALLLDRFNASNVLQDQCTLLVYTDGTVDLTHTAGCPGSKTVDQWGAGRLTIGDQIRVRTYYDQSQSMVCSGSCDMISTNPGVASGEIPFGWGTDGKCPVAAIPCTALPVGGTGKEYRSAGNYTPGQPVLSFSTVGGNGSGTQQRFVQCGGWTSASDLPNSESMAVSSDAWTIDNGAVIAIAPNILHAANSTGTTNGSGTPTGGTNNVDGTEATSGTFVWNGTAAKVRLLGRSGVAAPLTFEEGGCADYNSTAIRNALRANEKAFYGTP